MFDTEILPSDEDLLDPESDDDQGLPADLESIPPGLLLAVVLSSVDRDSLSGFDRVSLLKARSRLISHLQAELYADISAVSVAVSELANLDLPGTQDAFYTTASEVETALNLTRRAGEMHTDLAFQLTDRLPRVWEALHEGRIDLARARVLCDQTIHLPEPLAREVCDTALERASDQTTGQLRARIQRMIISIDPASAKDRYEQKLAERKIVCEPTDSGTANLYGSDLPADRANQAMRRINRLARKAKNAGDRRGIDQIRADLFLDLLTGRGENRQNAKSKRSDRAHVDIRVDLTTLLGLDENPGEIPGWGPIIADVARQITEHSHDEEWRIGITEQDQLLDVITTRRRPNTIQKRIVETLQPECVFPPCRIGSAECDLDHEIPWADTHQTSIRHLEPLCRHHHHRAKHGHWKLKQNQPGVYEWTSPLGHTYIVVPDQP